MVKTDTISLGPELTKELGECKVGETKDITLRVTVDGMDGGLKATVTSVVEYEDGEDEKPAPPKPKGPKPPSKRAPALMDAMGEEY